MSGPLFRPCASTRAVGPGDDGKVPCCPHCPHPTGRAWLRGGIMGGDSPAIYGAEGNLLMGRRGRRWDRWVCLVCGGEFVTTTARLADEQGYQGAVVCAPITEAPGGAA